MKSLIFCFVLLQFSQATFSQTEEIFKDETLLKTYLLQEQFDIDRDAHAVILFKKGRSAFVTPHSFYEVSCAIKILSPEALGEATVTITESVYNKIKKISAVVYNLEGGEVKKQQMEKADVVYEEIIDDNYAVAKFNIPNVKVGSIIYYKYTIERRNKLSLSSWNFQANYPCLYSEFELAIPAAVQYVSVERTDKPFSTVQSKSDLNDGQCEACTYLGSEGKNKLRIWARRHIPAFRSEPYVLDESNYLQGVQIYVQSYTPPGYAIPVNYTWKEFSKKILENQNAHITEAYSSGSFYKNKAREIANKDLPLLDQARAIYHYVQQHYRYISYIPDVSDRNLRHYYNQETITPAISNYILTALLRSLDMNAELVMVADRGSEQLNALLPQYDNIRRQITSLYMEGKRYLLDPSDPYHGFGTLAPDYYNGFAYVLTKEGGYGIDLSPDSLQNIDKISVTAKIDEQEPDQMHYSVMVSFGTIGSYQLRKQWSTNENAAKEYIMEQVTAANGDLNQYEVSHLQDPDKALTIQYDYYMPLSKNNTQFLHPGIWQSFKKNPFTESSVRIHPVQLDNAQTTYFYFTLKLPENYEVQDFPQPYSMALDELNRMAAIFRSDYQQQSHTYKSQLIFSINTTTYPADYYDAIRTFYSNIIKENSKLIAIKKLN